MNRVKIFLINGRSDQCERIEALKKIFEDALLMVDDVSELASYIMKRSSLAIPLTPYTCSVATVGSSVFLVVGTGSARHGNIILEGLVVKLDTLFKLSAFTLAKMNVDENMLVPKILRGSIREMKEFLRKEKVDKFENEF